MKQIDHLFCNQVLGVMRWRCARLLCSAVLVFWCADLRTASAQENTRASESRGADAEDYLALLQLTSSVLDLQYTEVKEMFVSGYLMEVSRATVSKSKRLGLLRVETELASLFSQKGSSAILSVLFDANSGDTHYLLCGHVVKTPADEAEGYAEQYAKESIQTASGLDVYKLDTRDNNGIVIDVFARRRTSEGPSYWKRVWVRTLDGIISRSEEYRESGLIVLRREAIQSGDELSENALRDGFDLSGGGVPTMPLAELLDLCISEAQQ